MQLANNLFIQIITILKGTDKYYYRNIAMVATKLPLLELIRFLQNSCNLNSMKKESSKMDSFDSLTDGQKQATFNYMQMFGVQMDEAIQKMTMYHFDINLALNEIIPQEERLPPQPLPQPELGSRNAPLNVDMNYHFQDENVQEERMGRRERFHANSRQGMQQYKKTYMIKKKQKPKPKRRPQRRGKKHAEIVQAEDKIEEQFDFFTEFSNLFEKKMNVAFKADLFQVFKEMLETKKLVALHSIPLTLTENMSEIQVAIEFIKVLYSLKQFAGSFNKNFINFGLDPNKLDYNHYPFMRDFINPSKDHFFIVILRFNEYTGKVEVFRKINIMQKFDTSQIEGISMFVQSIKRQSHRIAYNTSIGVKPLTQGEKRRIEEDRLIRQQQEKDYLQNMKAIEEGKIKEEMMKSEQNKEKEQQENISEKRAALRKQLVIHNSDSIQNPIAFKIRFPNSAVEHLTLPKEEKVHYLFDYFLSNDEDMGFDNEIDRKFQILQPYDRISLSTFKEQTLGSVFNNSDMETLVIKQK